MVPLEKRDCAVLWVTLGLLVIKVKEVTLEKTSNSVLENLEILVKMVLTDHLASKVPTAL